MEACHPGMDLCKDIRYSGTVGTQSRDTGTPEIKVSTLGSSSPPYSWDPSSDYWHLEGKNWNV